MSPWMALALAIIVGGGLAILSRLGLLAMAATFWLAFAAGIGVLALSGHEMLARWHLGPITGVDFWRVLVFSPEVLIFLFFMITDPRTIPSGRRGRVVFAVGVALLAVLLIAPQTTEFAHEGRAARRADARLRDPARPRGCSQCAPGRSAGQRSRPIAARARRARRRRLDRVRGRARAGRDPGAALGRGGGRDGRVDDRAAPGRDRTVRRARRRPRSRHRRAGRARPPRRAPRRVRGDPRRRSRASRRGRDGRLARDGLAAHRRGRAGPGRGRPPTPPTGSRSPWRPARGRASPSCSRRSIGTVTTETLEPGGARVGGDARAPEPVERTFELMLEDGRYVIARGRRGSESAATGPAAGGPTRVGALVDVAAAVGLDVRHDAFRLGMSGDPAAMMGGGLCWLDYDADGWTDLFVVNAYAESDRGALRRDAISAARGSSATIGGRFRDVTAAAGIDLRLKGTGCVAADLDLDGQHRPRRHDGRRTTRRVTPTTRCSGTTATARSPRAPRRPGSPSPAGTPGRPSATSTGTGVPTCSSPATRTSTHRSRAPATASRPTTSPCATCST